MLTKESRAAGVAVDKSGLNAPRPAQLDAYRAAMWGGFAFGVLGSLLAALFLRHVGIVGHRADVDDVVVDEETTAHAVGEPQVSYGEKEAEGASGRGSAEEKK